MTGGESGSWTTEGFQRLPDVLARGGKRLAGCSGASNLTVPLDELTLDQDVTQAFRCPMQEKRSFQLGPVETDHRQMPGVVQQYVGGLAGRQRSDLVRKAEGLRAP